ncbi:hypothetical protein BC941DRAFT_409788 [Chlamydoabsidia padenii]|nr:hypothetical protein BC941DRAFT_409788 [Chlamydoabsidia padenii]
MVMALFKRNKSKKATTKSIDTQHNNKLTLFFDKITRTPPCHKLKRPSMAHLASLFKSDSQILDQDKTYERRRYQQNMARQQQQQLTDAMLSSSASPIINDKVPGILIRRPSLTTSPSFDDHYKKNQYGKCDNISPTTDGIQFVSQGITHGDLIVEQRYIDTKKTFLLDQDKQSAYSTLFSFSTTTTNTTTSSPHIWDSAFWLDGDQPPPLLTRKISAPQERHYHHHQQQQSDDVPNIIKELRRINTITNDSMIRPLQRHRSFMVKKGRFEVSIETSTEADTHYTGNGPTLG